MSGLVIPPNEAPRLGAALVALGEVLIAIGQAQTAARAEPELLRWDRRHLNVLRRFAGTMPASDLADLFGVSEHALRSAASRASISLRIGTATDAHPPIASHQASPSPDASAAEPPTAAPSGTGPDTGPEPVPEAPVPPAADVAPEVDVAPEPEAAPAIEQAPSPEPVTDIGAAPAPVSAGTDEETAVSSAPAPEVVADEALPTKPLPAPVIEDKPAPLSRHDPERAGRAERYVEEAKAVTPAQPVRARPTRSEPVRLAMQPTNNDWVRLRHPDGRWLRMDGLDWTDKRANSYLVQRKYLIAVRAKFPLALECNEIAEPAWRPRDGEFGRVIR